MPNPYPLHSVNSWLAQWADRLEAAHNETTEAYTVETALYGTLRSGEFLNHIRVVQGDELDALVSDYVNRLSSGNFQGRTPFETMKLFIFDAQTAGLVTFNS